MSLAEDLDDLENPSLSMWQLQELALARRIIGSERNKALPSKFDIHGAGAFRHFKDAVRRHGIKAAWYQFREETPTEIMRDWCNQHDIAFDETDGP